MNIDKSQGQWLAVKGLDLTAMDTVVCRYVNEQRMQDGGTRASNFDCHLFAMFSLFPAFVAGTLLTCGLLAFYLYYTECSLSPLVRSSTTGSRRAFPEYFSLHVGAPKCLCPFM